jgi:tRNA 5-methylaminomethyl-2-thiouridine biosynthesis bifunctional protein
MLSRNAPWFRRADPIRKGGTVAIIGAGISGACMGAELVEAGMEPIVIDSHTGPAGGASGNPAGLIQPRPGGGNPAYERLQTSAYIHAVKVYDALSVGHDVWKGPRGVLSFGRDSTFLSRHSQWLKNGGLPNGHGTAVSEVDVSNIAGINLGTPGLWFKNAGTINPVVICRALLANVPTLFGKNVAKLERVGERWCVWDGKGACLLEADAVVLANGFAASQLCPEGTIPLHAKRGQISYLQATKASQNLQVGLSYGGYMTPALENGFHILGATYQQWPDHQSDKWKELTDDDHEENRAHISSRLPLLSQIFDGEIVSGRASLRTTTADHLPVVGPAFNEVAYRKDYHDLRHGKPAHIYPGATYTPGVYLLSALGSRGFALAPLLAKLLVAEIIGRPLPVDDNIHDLVSPARFLVRDLKRG